MSAAVLRWLEHFDAMEVMFMRALIGAVLVAVGVSTVQAADVSTREAERIREAATVLNEIHAVPDKDIPQELWTRAGMRHRRAVP